jgi:hypothetical protein
LWISFLIKYHGLEIDFYRLPQTLPSKVVIDGIVKIIFCPAALDSTREWTQTMESASTQGGLPT